MEPLLLNTIGALLILVAGTGLGYWIGNRRGSSESAKASEIREEFEDYRRNVTEHFGQTASHFQAIGKQYRELYEHMASGAEALCDFDGEADRLSFPKAVAPALTAGGAAEAANDVTDAVADAADPDGDSGEQAAEEEPGATAADSGASPDDGQATAGGDAPRDDQAAANAGNGAEREQQKATRDAGAGEEAQPSADDGAAREPASEKSGAERVYH